MTKSIITNHLNKFDYKYSEQDEKLTVELDFSLQIIIDLSVNEKIKLSDNLKRSNILTGPFQMSIKGSMIYSLILFSIGVLIFVEILQIKDPGFLVFFPIVFCWNFYWVINYLIRAENFKKEIINLTK
ncbi:MAG: hypothetical protein HXX16_13145 [Bacteroidales bacterium]|nr:hypothetical protein [Bacteroidales bacterium]